MELKKIVVAGGGVLGSQIAFQCAYKKKDVTVWLRSAGSIERATPKFDRLADVYKAELDALRDKCGTLFLPSKRRSGNGSTFLSAIV